MDELILSEKMNDIKTQFLLEAKGRIDNLVKTIEMNHVDVLTAMMFIRDSITIGNMEDAIHRIDYAIKGVLGVLSSMEEFRKGEEK